MGMVKLKKLEWVGRTWKLEFDFWVENDVTQCDTHIHTHAAIIRVLYCFVLTILLCGPGWCAKIHLQG